MNAPHEQQPATLLPNGQVLVLGVLTETPCCSAGFTAELYNPVSNSWSVTASPQYPRFNHIAEPLPNGNVLVATGFLSDGVTATAEIYDPGTASWTSTGSLATARQFASSAVLHDGRVLVTGGLGLNAGGMNFSVTLGSPELYDPKTGLWSSAGNMIFPVWLHSMTTLPDGRVLVAGGQDADTGFAQIPTTQLYDPATNTWTQVGDMNVARDAHTATLLPNGQVLVTGGQGANSTSPASAELYDPATNRWTLTASMSTPRSFQTGTLLPNGRVLIAGGATGQSFTLFNSTEIYDPATGEWSAGAPLQQARAKESATLLESGKVLVAGSYGTQGDFAGNATAEVYGTTVPSATGMVNVSSASYFDNGAVAPGSLVSAMGSNLAGVPQTAPSTSLPTTLGGVSVTVEDSTGMARQAGLVYVSPQVINYLLPAGTAPGTATVSVNGSDGAAASGQVLVVAVAPGVFAANSSGQGLAAAVVQRVHADGTQVYEPVAQFDAGQNQFVPVPINLSSTTDQVFLVLFGTGIASRSSLAAVNAQIGSAIVRVSFAGPSGDFPGLDQVNLLLPPALAGSGNVGVTLSVDGFAANTVRVTIE
jgi:uncharacterized protein (TIGR03437 family)